ncbi:hypothetical protein OIU85_003909 [Salix viminalis]|uniref:DUF8040 domain-containing protein n=1 Tax=Salix viminalis TaxID=40686 RepID=A0A9Q0Q042_SALVM|nr:hypothetical protein OIU85_003909 [Salix viminalis]
MVCRDACLSLKVNKQSRNTNKRNCFYLSTYLTSCIVLYILHFNPISTDTLASMEDFDLELDKMELVAAAAGYYYYNSITWQPRHSSLPYGSSFMSEVLDGPDDGCQEMFQMDKHVFHNLCGILKQRGMLRDTAGVMIEEQLTIFLNIIGHNERNRVIQERFGIQVKP